MANMKIGKWLLALFQKSAWTSTEDDLLLSLYKSHGTKWSTIARGIPGRTDDACSKRYREALDPALKKDEWTPEEDTRLMELFAEIGGKWGQVGQELQRSGLGCRNREAKVFYDPIPTEISKTPRVSSVASSNGERTSDLWAEPSYPYYPPEAYPCFPGEQTSSLHGSFRAPTPEITAISPDEAPFQFSSSSLSAALAVVPQISAPSPAAYEPPDQTLPSQSDPHAAPSHHIHQTSPDDFDLPVNFMPSSDLSKLFLGVHFDDNGVFQYPEVDNDSSIDLTPGIEGQHWSQIMPSPVSTYDQLGVDSLSSTLSTPYSFPPPLSDCSTPKSSSPVELSANEHHPGLTSSPNRRSQRMRARKARKITVPDRPLRLSSSLILTTE
ncbi:hypothetical protein H0H87_006262 [Tephrocybe sp. NHM501043]|nr:hypothetical protein H0H87_006262 [Tephrocybe sp. NHM501043]